MNKEARTDKLATTKELTAFGASMTAVLAFALWPETTPLAVIGGIGWLTVWSLYSRFKK